MSKVQTDRITKIVQLIRKRGSISMSSLMERFEVSKPTIKRDLEFLRSRSNCPIHWDRKKRGYVIRDDQVEGGHFELPGVWFDSSEIFAILTMLHLVDGMQPDLLGEHIAPLKSRLRDMLAKGSKSATTIERKLKLIHFAPRRVELKHFQTVAGALLDGKRLNLRYWNRERKEETMRTISPQQLVHYRENWLLDAWCHTKNGLRSFALEAIRGVQVLDELADEVSEEEMAKHFQSGYGIFAGPAAHIAKLRFTPDRAQWISQEIWHHNQVSRYLPDGSYVLEIPYSIDQELLMDILRYSPDVEVLSPLELRRKLKATLSAAAANNS